MMSSGVPCTVARFGQLTFRGLGKLSFQTRSGNTDKADGSWSDWSPPLTAAGPSRSPGARFLQVRASLDSAEALVYAIEVFYLPQNQPALVSDVMAEPPASAHGQARFARYEQQQHLQAALEGR